jgi:hypothetical protein
MIAKSCQFGTARASALARLYFLFSTKLAHMRLFRRTQAMRHAWCEFTPF